MYKKIKKFAAATVFLGMSVFVFAPVSVFAATLSQAKYGDRGDNVTSIQNILVAKGFLKVSANGRFGPATFAAIKAFQIANNLPGVGTVGPRTLEVLLKNLIATDNSSGSATEKQSTSSSDSTNQTLHTKDLWTNHSGSSTAGNWLSIASDATGTKLVATKLPAISSSLTPSADSGIYTSTDAGITWKQTSSPPGIWYDVASSADGTKLAATRNVYGTSGINAIYTSTDSGATWTQTSAPTESDPQHGSLNLWVKIASSPDGTKLIASQFYGGHIYVSTNGGASWTLTTAPSTNWGGVTIDTTGMKLAATGDAGVYTSTDGGLTWTRRSPPAGASLAATPDGTRLMLAAGLHGIYTSNDSGLTWILRPVSSAPQGNWISIASDSTGLNLIAAQQGSWIVCSLGPNHIYTSANGGITWTMTNAAPEYWSDVASSADGTKLAATAGGNSDQNHYVWENSGRTGIDTSILGPSCITTPPEAKG